MFPLSLHKHLFILGHPYFHVYLIKGKNASALVETGISATADVVIGQLASLGVRPDYLVVTHPHSDHICGLDALKQAFPDAAVIAGHGASAFLDHPKAIEAYAQEDSYMGSFLSRHGIISGRHTITTSPALSGCMAVGDDNQIDLGEIKARFLVAKGHAPGNIVVHIPELNALLTSDSLGYHYPGWGFFPIFFTGYADYVATINVLESLKPEIIGMAHNGFTQGSYTRIMLQEARKAAESVMTRIVNDKREDRAIVHDLFSYYYHDELTLYTMENILVCCRLLVRRAKEYQAAS
jgi:glyoxylase-like metal-dependent hydrolase (beta-lactamase superfamily II)